MATRPSNDRVIWRNLCNNGAPHPELARLVIVEGNHLLVDQSPWESVAGLLSESWFCETSDAERLRGLVDRHERHGRSPEAAEAWATTVDGANAILIEASRPRATLVVSGVDASIIRGSRRPPALTAQVSTDPELSARRGNHSRAEQRSLTPE
ncbi:hypothetical protein BH09ACT6_BH09ACT6_26810 [soil metagenome]